MPKKFKLQATNEIMVNLKQKAAQKADAMNQAAAGAQADVAELGQLELDIAGDLKAQYDQGFADGVASVVLPSPTDPAAQYTQAQLDAAVAEGKQQVMDEMQPKVDEAVAQRDEAMVHAESVKTVAEAAILDMKAKDDLLADAALETVKNA